MSSLKNDVREIFLGLLESYRTGINESRQYLKDSWRPVLLMTLVLLVTWFYINPPPPRHIYLSSGSAGSTYELMAKKYADFFSKQGITLTLISTSNDLENIELQDRHQNNAHATFAQAGVYKSEKYKTLQSLGDIAYEPIWFFYRSPGIVADDFNGTPEGFAKIAKAKIWLGKPNTASYDQALNILKALDFVLSESNARHGNYEDGVAAIKMGEVDGLFLVDSLDSAMVQSLLLDEEIHLAHIQTAEAFKYHLNYLKTIKVPQGGFNLRKNLPSKDIQILATTTQILVDKDMHPAIQFLFLIAAKQINGATSLFTQRGEFPTYKSSDFPESSVAHRFEENGSPWLMEYFPFWLAELINRITVIVLPIFVMAYPFLIGLPSFRLKRTKKKLAVIYAELRSFEHSLVKTYSLDQIDEHLATVNRLEQRALQLTVPESLISEWYSLRSTIDSVRASLTRGAYNFED